MDSEGVATIERFYQDTVQAEFLDVMDLLLPASQYRPSRTSHEIEFGTHCGEPVLPGV